MLALTPVNPPTHSHIRYLGYAVGEERRGSHSQAEERRGSHSLAEERRGSHSLAEERRGSHSQAFATFKSIVRFPKTFCNHGYIKYLLNINSSSDR